MPTVTNNSVIPNRMMLLANTSNMSRTGYYRPQGKKVMFTVRNSSCEKVMFLQVSFCPQGGVHGWQGGGVCGRSGYACVAGETATAVDGTGMHSCFRSIFLFIGDRVSLVPGPMALGGGGIHQPWRPRILLDCCLLEDKYRGHISNITAKVSATCLLNELHIRPPSLNQESANNSTQSL